MNENNDETPDQELKAPEPATTEAQQMAPQVQEPKKPSSKKLWFLLALAALIIAGLVAYILMNKKDDTPSQQPQTETNTTAQTEEIVAEPKEKPAIDCEDDELFADKEVGFAFCYPNEWGDAEVVDAKVSPDDTGHRESITFSDNNMFSVGGVSTDWSTTVGRDTSCLEPNNVVPELSSYDTEWHDVIGSGMAVEFAMRSLESSEGGYDMTETVSNMLESGVCAQGHKTINGSRYKVAFAGFFEDFSAGSGITTPKAHMDNSDILFTETQRSQYDALLASLIKY